MIAVARRTDPETSHAAARSVADLTGKQQAVLDLLRASGPMTDEQLIDAYRQSAGLSSALWPEQSESGIRTRRSELARRGLVESVGTASTRSGRTCRVWCPTW